MYRQLFSSNQINKYTQTGRKEKKNGNGFMEPCRANLPFHHSDTILLNMTQIYWFLQEKTMTRNLHNSCIHKSAQML